VPATWANGWGYRIDSRRGTLWNHHVEELPTQAPKQGDKNGQARGVIDKAGAALEGH